MANVHRIGDYNDGQGNQPNAQAFPATGRGQPLGAAQGQGQQGGGGMGARQQVLFMSDGDDGGNAMSPYPPLNKVLAPNFNKKTFIFVITIIQIIIFIAELFVGQFKYDGAFVKGNDMAGPGTMTFLLMGGKYLPNIRHGEVHRFIVPCVLHAGILHIFTNLVSQTMIGYTCEKWWGPWKTCFFYLMTAWGASLLSSVGSPCSVSVGASGSLLGIIGAHMAWILMNWNDSTRLRNPCQRMCTMIWWLFIIFMIGISSKGIDNLAHLGGLISGVLLAFSFDNFTDPVSWMQGNEKTWKYGGLFCLTVYFVGTLVGTFITVNASCGFIDP